MQTLSAYDKEVQKWDRPRSQGGMRPDHFEAFPRMLYKARQKPTGGPYIVVDPSNEQWSAGNCLSVPTEELFDRAKRDGWCETPAEAIEAAERAADAVARAAAERAYADRRMSEKARAEAEAADDATFEHLPEIPQAPLKRGPGRPRKVVEPAAS